MIYPGDDHRRRSIRLSDYDYTQAGAYFVTICAQDRACLFGDVVNGHMEPTEAGACAETTWRCLPEHYPHVTLDAFTVMPNHVHCIIMPRAGLKPAPTVVDQAIGSGHDEGNGVVGARFKPARPAGEPPRHGLPEIVRAFKTYSSRSINQQMNSPGTPVWQRNYYEHIIRDEDSLNRIREYIMDNPIRWQFDHDNPINWAPSS
ncbi:MAG: transposase [Armatimonadetes bacterium]|nr:transposase [Armatimonadota bacterium]